MMETRKPRINIRSFDFDGCIFNSNYLKYLSGWAGLLLCNDELLNSISAQLKKESFDDVIVMSGSFRQSYLHDKAGCVQNGSTTSFGAIKTIAAELGNRSQKKCCVDKFLLVDLLNDHYAGYSFALAVDHDSTHDHPVLVDADEIKFSILYSQLHKIASENPGAEIVYDFYDDRIDILTVLKGIFTKYPELIPPGVTVNLHRYTGGSVVDVGSLAANKDSKLDYNYRHNIKNYLKSNAGKFHKLSMAHIEKFKKDRVFISESLRESEFDLHEHAAAVLDKPYSFKNYVQKQSLKEELTAYILLCEKEKSSLYNSLVSFFSSSDMSIKIKAAGTLLSVLNKIEDSKGQLDHVSFFTSEEMSALLEPNSQLVNILNRYPLALPVSFVKQKKVYEQLEVEKLIKKIEGNIQVNLASWS